MIVMSLMGGALIIISSFMKSKNTTLLEGERAPVAK